jgi:hypothetical protein
MRQLQKDDIIIKSSAMVFLIIIADVDAAAIITINSSPAAISSAQQLGQPEL